MKKFGIFLCFVGGLLLIGGGLMEFGVLSAIFGETWEVNPEFLISEFDDKNWIPFMNEKGLYGYMDQDGKIIIEPKYLEARNYVHGLAIVKDSSGKTFEIDRNGEIIFEVNKDLGGISIYSSPTNGVINVNGKFYDTYYNPVGSFLETYEEILMGSALIRYNSLTKKYALVDFTNQVIYESDKKLEVDTFYHKYTFSLYLVVKEENKITIINDDTKKIVYTIENANDYVFETHDLGFTLIRIDDSSIKSFYIGTNDTVVYDNALSYEVYEGHYIKAFNTDGTYTFIDGRKNKIINQDEIESYEGLYYSKNYADLFDVYTCKNSDNLESLVIDGEKVMDCSGNIGFLNISLYNYLYENYNRKIIFLQLGKEVEVHDLVENKVIKTLSFKEVKDAKNFVNNTSVYLLLPFNNRTGRTEIYSTFYNTTVVLDGTPQIFNKYNHVIAFYEDINTYQYYNKKLELIYSVTLDSDNS